MPRHNESTPCMTLHDIPKVVDMNLRDWFAGRALTVLLSVSEIATLKESDVKVTADIAYLHADAMIERRKR